MGTVLQVKAACNKPGLVPKLEIIVTELEKCKKSLSEYLRYVNDAIEIKRAPAFPQRFRKRQKQVARLHSESSSSGSGV